MKRTDFDLIRRTVSAREAAERFGLTVNRHGKARCPWHNDKNPSLSFRDGYCHCFVCLKGGSCIDIAAQLLGLSPAEAAAEVAREFGIAAFTEIDPAEARKRREELAAAKARAEKEKQEAADRFNLICDALHEAERRLDNMIERYGMSAGETDAFWRLLGKKASLEVLAELEVGA